MPKPLLLPLVVALLVALTACETEPMTDADAGYFDATLKGKGECPGAGHLEYWYEYGTIGFGEWNEAPHDELDCTGSTPTVTYDKHVVGLSDGVQYRYRLCGTLNGGGRTCYDSTGQAGGTNYDTFTTDAFPTATAKAAKSFRNTVGVNVKSAYINTPPYSDYNTYTNLKNALTQIGARRLREGLWPKGNFTGEKQRPLFRWYWQTLGAKYDVGFGNVKNPQDRIDLPTRLAELKDPAENLLPGLASVEGVNEPNHNDGSGPPPANWADLTREWQQFLWNNTRDIGATVIGPALGGVHEENELGNLDAWLDWGNMHPYRGCGKPETAVEQESPFARVVAGQSSPIAITEFGWAVDWVRNGDERIQAAYLLRAYLDYFSKGVPVSYVQQIVDYEPLSTDPHAFGLFKIDWSPRLQATALGRMNSAIGDNGGTAPLKVIYEQQPGDLRKVTLQQADGDHIVALWREAALQTDQCGALASQPTAQNVRMWLPNASGVQATRPLDSGSATPVTLGGDKRANVLVGPEPVILEIAN